MGYILLVSENSDIQSRIKSLIDKKNNNFSCFSNQTSIYDMVESEQIDVCLIDENMEDINPILVSKKIKSRQENCQIILLTNDENINDDFFKIVNGFISLKESDKLISSTINCFKETKNNIDKISQKNRDLTDSLYKLNVLYSTSSQFAGTLDIKQLLDYMSEGLDKSLSFDLNYILSFGFEQTPVLIVNSLYNVSEEFLNALKTRAIFNYKSLFDGKEIPFEIDESDVKIIKNIKNPNEKFNFSLFQYDNMFAPIDLGDKFFGCIEIFKQKTFTTDDSAYFQTIVRQVSLPLKSAGLYKEIIEKNHELEKLERVKSEFISIVSHELRTPLTPIKNALSILLSGKCGGLTENASKFINMAKRNADNLTNIINDILDINKIEAGKMEFNYRIMNIYSVVENVKSAFDIVAKEHDISLIVDNQEDLPDIYADSQRLGQVLTNLVSNAIKFTPDGKNITIRSELKNADDIAMNPYFENDLKCLSGDYIMVSVTDEGIGIKSDDILKAFDKFSQIENSLTRKSGGTGLGLPIARQLIKAHKGTIWCDSEEGKGSSFHFVIPVSSEITPCKTVEKELL